MKTRNPCLAMVLGLSIPIALSHPAAAELVPGGWAKPIAVPPSPPPSAQPDPGSAEPPPARPAPAVTHKAPPRPHPNPSVQRQPPPPSDGSVRF